MTRRSYSRIAALAFSLGLMLPATASADTYTYDAQGRLVSVTYSGGGSVTYTYDDAGNRTQQVKAP